MRKFFDVLRQHWRLLLGAACLVFVGSIGVRGRYVWERVWNAQMQAPKKPASLNLIDPTFAKDPAIEGAKLKVIGPLANAMRQQEPAADSDQTPVEAQPISISDDEAAKFDGVAHERYAPVSVCRGKFVVSSSRAFHFQVPPHASFPKIKGHIASSASGAAHPIELLIVDEQQYAHFVRGDLDTPLFQNQMSSGDLDFRLNGTHNEVRQYYLVLNSPGRAPLSVQAKFTLVFDSSNE